MDTRPAAPLEPSVQFVPDRRFTALAGTGAVLALLLVLVTGDPPGRLLFGLAAAVLVAYAVTDLVYSPRLVADPYGLTIRSVLTRAIVPWTDVESVSADTRERFGLRSTTLEVDAGALLVVFSRRALGTDPAEAARRIGAVWWLS